MLLEHLFSVTKIMISSFIRDVRIQVPNNQSKAHDDPSWWFCSSLLGFSRGAEN